VIDEQTSKPRSSFWRELPFLLGVAILVAVLVRAFVLQTFYIPSPSMQHTLELQDRVLVNKLVYDFRDPHRGEIIVFKSPLDWRSDPSEEDFIKRVIGVAGDHVICCDAKGRITVNEQPLDETSYLYTDSTGQQSAPSDIKFDVVVPDGRIFVLGDNRGESRDSRCHLNDPGTLKGENAFVSEDLVVGRAIAVAWPLADAARLPIPTTYDSVPPGKTPAPSTPEIHAGADANC
jgi:signal peptidase I